MLTKLIGSVKREFLKRPFVYLTLTALLSLGSGIYSLSQF